MIGMLKHVLHSLQIYNYSGFEKLSKALRSHLVFQNHHKSLDFTKIE